MWHRSTGSGYITFDELVDVIRHKLKKGPSAMSDDTVMALWCHLDADDSNEILPQEMSKFLKRNLQKSRGQENLNKKKIELGGAQTAGLGRALESTPTAEMRASLQAPLTEDQMLELSKHFNEWLEASIYASNRSTHSWFNLFKEIDEDGSGYITFDEFEDVIRHKLKQPKKVISDERVKAIWCALDADDSNQIMPQEMGKWLKQGADEVTSKAPKNLNKKKIELGGAQTAGLGRALESTPTAEMRASLEAPLTEEELDDLSRKMCRWMEELLAQKNQSVHSWYNLFSEADEDASGFITCVAACRDEPAETKWMPIGSLPPPRASTVATQLALSLRQHSRHLQELSLRYLLTTPDGPSPPAIPPAPPSLSLSQTTSLKTCSDGASKRARRR